MIEEVHHLQQALQLQKEESIAGRSYYTGTLWDQDVVLVFSRYGKVAAASTATTLIDRFGAELLLFTGVAGGASPEVKIGDIVIADRLVQHDMDASPTGWFKRFEVPGTNKTHFEVPESLVELAVRSAEAYATTHHPSLEVMQEFGIHSPTVHTGVIASGDQFVASQQLLDDLRNHLPGLKCVEMEGAAVAQVGHEHGVPVVVVRSISDSANHEAHVDFPRFIEQVASFYSLGIVQRILEGLPR